MRAEPGARNRLAVREATPADWPKLMLLFEACFGAPIAAGGWGWKYRQVPGLARSIVGESETGEIVAHAGAIALPVGGGAHAGSLIWQLVDFMASRRGGLRRAIVTVGQQLLAPLPREQDLPWVFGFPSQRHYRLGERVFSYRLLPPLRLVSGSLELPQGSLGAVDIGDSCGPWTSETWRACELWGVERSAAFLNWRYHARPDRYYRFYRLASPARGPDGLAVFAFEGHLAKGIELWLPPGCDWRPLLLEVARDLRSMGMQHWRFVQPSNLEARRQLQALGLRQCRETLFMGCRGRSGGPDPGAASDGFSYAWGDYDAV